MSEQGWKDFLAAQDLDDWAVLHGGPTAVFRTGSMLEAAQLAVALTAVPGVAGPRAAFTITDGRLTVRLTREMWRTEADHIELARALSAVAREHGATADLAAVQEVQVAISAKPDEIDLGFWRAILGYDAMADDNGIDPLGHGSTVWMQDLPEAKALRHAMHIDVSVPREHAQARFAAAIAAGGRIVDESGAPGYWILADRAGNKVCIAAWPDGAVSPADDGAAAEGSGVTLFRYDAAIIERYPTVVAGTLHVTRARNGPTSPDLAEAFRAEQAAALARLGDTPLSEIPSLNAWRRAFRAFGVDPTAYRSASESLLRRLTKQGSIPSINTLVDIGNLVSIRHALPVAVFDLASIDTGLTVRFAIGDESFVDLGSGATETPDPGEVIFIDAAGHVAARRWCWRQSASSASSATTTDMLVTVEGHHDGARQDVLAATADLEQLLRTHAAATEVQTGLVDQATSALQSVLPR